MIAGGNSSVQVAKPWLSRFYDASLEKLYREARSAAAAALDLAPGLAILDVPCGTGQSFEALREGIGDSGRIVGVDLSEGMLREATRRIEKHAWTNVEATVGDAGELAFPAASFDRVHVFLGMSVFRDPDAVLDKLWSLLRPGGRCVIVDVFAEKLGVQGRLVNWTAGADIRRRSWEPLELRCTSFERRDLPSKWQHGGTLFLAAGDKPR